MAIQNAFTERYIDELKAQLAIIENAVIRGVPDYNEYTRLIGKHSGIAAALAYFEESLAVLDSQE